MVAIDATHIEARDRKAIPLLKSLSETHPYLKPLNVLADGGYDYHPIYQQVRNMEAKPLIDYNPRNEQLLEDKDKYFHSKFQNGHSYRYNSHDPHFMTP